MRFSAMTGRHYHFVSRQHGKDVGARVVSRQASTATSVRRSKVLFGGIKQSFAISRKSVQLEYSAENGTVGWYRGFNVQSASGSLPEVKYGRNRRVRGLEVIRNYPSELHSRGILSYNSVLVSRQMWLFVSTFPHETMQCPNGSRLVTMPLWITDV